MTLLSAGAGTGGAEEEAEDFAAPIRPLLREYCYRCHDDETQEGGVELTGLRSESDLLVHRRLWESVAEQVELEEMPTKGPFPAGEERERMAGWLRERLGEVDWSGHRSPGRVTLPRLTRDEYRHTMRDLLGVDLNAGDELPEDGEGSSGFTTDRDNLALGAAQLELYLGVAERALAGAFALARPPAKAAFAARDMERSPPRLPPHEGGVVITHPDHELRADVEFPVDGWYVFRIEAAALGGVACTADFRAGGERVASAEAGPGHVRATELVEATGFVRAGRYPVTVQSRNLVPQTPEPPDINRVIDETARELAPRLGPLAEEESPAVREAREAMNHKAWGVQESVEWLRFLGPGGDPRKIDLRRVYQAEREGQRQELGRRLAGEAGLAPEEVERRWTEENAARLADNAAVTAAVAHVKWEDWSRHQGKLYVESLEIEGPVRPAFPRAEGWNLVDALRDPGTSPEALVRGLLPLAFRRPAGDEEAGRYLALLAEAQRGAETREEALTLALSAILSSPRFLYRDELPEEAKELPGTEPAEARPLDAWALASRLSYFLWQTMPSPELRRLAASGELLQPEILAREADRMLDDPRAAAFFSAFASDWLGIRELGRGVMPDLTRYPGFTLELAEAMKEESIRLVEAVFREDQPLEALVDSPVAYLNETLARHYGVAGVEGDHFRPVALPDRRRGGVLGLGSVLVATSSPARSNPVRRGAWVLERLLGEDPGEALPTAGELPGDAGEARGRTLREELDLHRTQADCARCHRKIDPLGFGLQNFDAIGRWRDLEAGAPVDASGRLPGGAEFSGPEELKRVLLEQRREAIVENLARRLLAFALGRELAYFDIPLIAELAAEADASGGSSRALVRAIVRSEPFRWQAPPERES